MAHKVSPIAFRLGYIKSWLSNWYASRNSYSNLISNDILIRNYVKWLLTWIPIWTIFINHIQNKEDSIKIIIYSIKTSLILWKEWKNLENISNKMKMKFNKNFIFEIKEEKKPEVNANLTAFMIAKQIEKRMPYRRVIKQAIQKWMEKWAMWIKVIIAWRLGWAEIARSELYKDWNIPAQTIRADIDYTSERAETMYGTIWIKVWIYKWDIY